MIFKDLYPEQEEELLIEEPMFKGDEWSFSVIRPGEVAEFDISNVLLSSEQAIELAQYIICREAHGYRAVPTDE